MKYVSIDLETTGLDPDTCDVIEFAAVVDDTLKPDVPVEQLPHYRRLVRREVYRGEPYALAMHGDLMREAANEEHAGCIAPEMLHVDFEQWAVEVGILNADRRGKILAAGKNFAGFDLRFLRRLPSASPWLNAMNVKAPWDKLFSHRVLDPAMLFTLAEDERPPSLEQCLDRAGFVKTVSHQALDDARDVVRCIRAGLSRVRELSESKRTELERRLAAALLETATTKDAERRAWRKVDEVNGAAERLAHEASVKAAAEANERAEKARLEERAAQGRAHKAEDERRHALEQVATLRGQLAALNSGNRGRQVKYLEAWKAWAELRMTKLDDEGVTGDWDWDKANPEPKPSDFGAEDAEVAASARLAGEG